MDKNIENILEEFKRRVEESTLAIEGIERYFKGFGFSKKKDDMKNYEWMRVEDCKPEGFRSCWVSWWDNENEGYVQPIKTYWCKDRERFFLLEYKEIIAVDVDIWCYVPELPEERL